MSCLCSFQSKNVSASLISVNVTLFFVKDRHDFEINCNTKMSRTASYTETLLMNVHMICKLLVVEFFASCDWIHLLHCLSNKNIWIIEFPSTLEAPCQPTLQGVCTEVFATLEDIRIVRVTGINLGNKDWEHKNRTYWNKTCQLFGLSAVP